MDMFRTLLLPFDGSDTARVVLPTVLGLVAKLGGEVVVLHCLDADDDASGDPSKALADEIRGQGIEARAEVSSGNPADAIVDAAGALGATAIAMSTHGRTGLARWALGSVAERVVRTSPVPVLLARAPEDAATPAFEQVLVPLDGTAEALRVVEPVAALLAALGAHATLLHAVSDYRGKAAMEAGREHLDEAERAFASQGAEVTTALHRGHPATVIADYGLLEASQERPDLIVMATHARKGVPRMLLGSVTEKVLRAAVTPLLVLPPEG